MRDGDYAKLLEDTQGELLGGARPVAVLGLTPVTLRLLASLAPAGLDRAVQAVYVPAEGYGGPPLTVPVRPLPALREAGCWWSRPTLRRKTCCAPRYRSSPGLRR